MKTSITTLATAILITSSIFGITNSATAQTTPLPLLPLASNTAKATAILALCSFTTDMTQRVIEQADKDGTPAVTFAAAFVVSAYISGTASALSLTIPSAVKPVATKCRETVRSTMIVFVDWYEKNLPGNKVASAFQPIQKQIVNLRSEVVKVGKAEKITETQITKYEKQVYDELKQKFNDSLSRIGSQTSATTKTQPDGYISKENFIGQWPFRVDSGTLKCYPELNSAITFKPTDGSVEYAINAPAKGAGRFGKVISIQASPDSRYEDVIDEGLKLCKS